MTYEESVELKYTSNFCSNCGNRLIQGVKYCSNCGIKITQNAANTLDLPAGKLNATVKTSPELNSHLPLPDGKDMFNNDGKCPYCSSENFNQKLLEGPYSEKAASDIGYWYKCDCKCKKCGKEWFALEYFHSKQSVR